MTGPFTDDERVVGEMIENAGFKKDDSGKPRLSLLPAVGLEEIAIVMQFGAEKTKQQILFLLWYYHNGVGEDDRSS